MSWKQFCSDYLGFTRREKLGVAGILIAIITTWFFPRLISSNRARELTADTSWISLVKNLEINSNEDREKKSYEPGVPAEERDLGFQKTVSQSRHSELFYFDPNNLTAAGWEKLGLRSRTIQTILNYLKKGGHFNKPEDLQKIYGLHKDEWERLAPFIKIEKPDNAKADRVFSYKPAVYTNQASGNNPRYTVIDINTADTGDFISLPGIGSKLAQRIISFREKLGGFYSIDQVKETYGLADSTFRKIMQYLKLENYRTRKININTATKDDLKTHPYIRWNIANAIVEYRNTHGNFSSTNDLKKITIITNEVFNKILPYLVF